MAEKRGTGFGPVLANPSRVLNIAGWGIVLLAVVSRARLLLLAAARAAGPCLIPSHRGAGATEPDPDWRSAGDAI
jgi:hypothetical protein